MLGAAESNAFSAECYSTSGIAWIISICPHAQFAYCVCPLQQLLQVSLFFKVGVNSLNNASENFAGCAVYRYVVSLTYDYIRSNHPEEALFLMNANTLGSCYTRETQAASYNGRMARGNAACSQYALSNQHAMHIIRAGFRTHQHDWRSSFTQLFRTVGVKYSFAASSPR